jgi:hypothetical protein
MLKHNGDFSQSTELAARPLFNNRELINGASILRDDKLIR